MVKMFTQPLIHPLLLFVSQILFISFVVGFLPPLFIIRAGFLPIVICLAYGIIASGSEWCRVLWASLFSGFANGFVLHYIDVALLSSWSWESKGPSILGKKHFTTAKSSSKMYKSFQRFQFGILAAFSYRKLNTPYEVRNAPHFTNKIPTRKKFLATRLLLLLISVLIMDFWNTLPSPEEPERLFSSHAIPLLSRLDKLEPEELIVRLGSTIVFWSNMYCILQFLHAVASFIAVGLNLSTVDAWRPLFGRWNQTSDLRGFWG